MSKITIISDYEKIGNVSVMDYIIITNRERDLINDD